MNQEPLQVKRNPALIESVANLVVTSYSSNAIFLDKLNRLRQSGIFIHKTDPLLRQVDAMEARISFANECFIDLLNYLRIRVQEMKELKLGGGEPGRDEGQKVTFPVGPAPNGGSDGSDSGGDSPKPPVQGLKPVDIQTQGEL